MRVFHIAVKTEKTQILRIEFVLVLSCLCDVFVFGCVWLCLVVSVCVVGCLSVGVDALAAV